MQCTGLISLRTAYWRDKIDLYCNCQKTLHKHVMLSLISFGFGFIACITNIMEISGEDNETSLLKQFKNSWINGGWCQNSWFGLHLNSQPFYWHALVFIRQKCKLLVPLCWIKCYFITVVNLALAIKLFKLLGNDGGSHIIKLKQLLWLLWWKTRLAMHQWYSLFFYLKARSQLASVWAWRYYRRLEDWLQIMH